MKFIATSAAKADNSTGSTIIRASDTSTTSSNNSTGSTIIRQVVLILLLEP